MKTWGYREIKILRNNYTKKSRKELCNLLFDKTWDSIKYKASKLGLSFWGNDEERFWKFVNKKNTDQCWNWLGSLNYNGYGKFTVNKKDVRSHRFSWVLHNAEIPYGMWVCHKCDNPRCVNPEHLFLGTPQDDANDRKRKNRQAKGEKNGRAKLKLFQVRLIRKLKGKSSLREIADRFGVTQVLIALIHKNKIWKE